VHQVCAKLHVGRGDFEAAVGHLDAARRLTVKTVDPQYRAELRAREAELALWRARPDEARAAVAAGLHDLVGTDDVWFIGPLLWLGLRAEADLRDESVGRKIAHAETQRVPVILVVGDREAEDGTVSVRRRGAGNLGARPLEELREELLAEVRERRP